MTVIDTATAGRGGPVDLDDFEAVVAERNPGESEFRQAVAEVAESVVPFINTRPEYYENRILQRMTEPDRIVIFRVAWEDDSGIVRLNRGYRVQFNNAIGPYKGGLRFDPSVSLSVLKFLGFEQTFKNSLTGLPMGGAKGGSDFNPRGKSDREVMRFCQAFMTALYRHIGPDVDVPAGDIGVGGREISYLFGQHKRLTNRFTGVLTGKGLSFGGSLIRTEATGYGCVYFAQDMLTHASESLDGRSAVVSGAGNVALHTAEKLIDLGANVLTLSDRSGVLHTPEGLTTGQLAEIDHAKTVQRRSLADIGPSVGLRHLDPAGTVDMRNLLRSLGEHGTTVMVSSHLLSEIQAACDRLVVIQEGQLVFAGELNELLAQHRPRLIAQPADPDKLDLLRDLIGNTTQIAELVDDHIEVNAGADWAPHLFTLAAEANIPLAELRTHHVDLEEAFLEMTATTKGAGAR